MRHILTATFLIWLFVGLIIFLNIECINCFKAKHKGRLMLITILCGPFAIIMEVVGSIFISIAQSNLIQKIDKWLTE